MKKSIIVSFLSIVFLLFYIINHSTINYVNVSIIALLILIIPYLLGVVFSFSKNYSFWKVALFSAIILCSLQILFLIFSYRNSDIPDLHIDSNNMNANQLVAENSVKQYILNNANFPETYISIKFGELGKSDAYKIDDNYNLSKIKHELENGNRKTFDQLIDTKSKERINIEQYSMPHTYELTDVLGVKHRCLAHIDLDSSFSVISLINGEDIIVKFWNERTNNTQNWNSQFGK